ncbi:hypothetical protein E9993_07590 [Labilibacter sediminis]|nr:hypothetical protein E9993_07590 [Labilibacter sediminis]
MAKLNIIKYIKATNKHIKILAATLILGGMFVLMRGDELIEDKSLFLLSLIFIQMEFFFWLGQAIFKFYQGKTPKEITRNIVVRYILYYLICLAFAAISYIALLGLLYIKNGVLLSKLIPNFFKFEFEGWFIGTNIGLTFGAFLFFLLQ